MSERTGAAARIAESLRAAGYPVAVRTGESSPCSTGRCGCLYIGIFGFVAAVLAVIVILSAAIVMTMAVTERTREIGTLRSARHAAGGGSAACSSPSRRSSPSRAASPGPCSRS
jgi:hypothetical protein